ncbi:hypothetical protein C8Q75DRAFT_890403 [Abortiporus biennis]|nr:hypothetical protein C8Q75DRAFT_890403 [Abortiporus biennis]
MAHGRCYRIDERLQAMSSNSSSTFPLVAISNFHFDNTLGALLIAVIVCTFLAGIGFLQTFLYLTSTTSSVNRLGDNAALRWLIVMLWVLDMASTVFGSYDIYRYAITDYANPAALPIINWSSTAYILTGGVIDFCVRSVFIYRVWLLSRMPIISIIMMVLNFVILASCSVISAKYVQIGNFFELGRIKWLFTFIFTLIAFLDTLIAIVLSFWLWRKKSGGVFQQTDSQIDTLMTYAIHTGALTSLFSIAVLTTYLKMPNNLIFVGIYVIVPKLYHNALLASLNGRRTILKSKDDKGYKSIHLSSVLPSSSSVGDGDRRIVKETGIINISPTRVHELCSTSNDDTMTGILTVESKEFDELKHQDKFV